MHSRTSLFTKEKHKAQQKRNKLIPNKNSLQNIQLKHSNVFIHRACKLFKFLNKKRDPLF